MPPVWVHGCFYKIFHFSLLVRIHKCPFNSSFNRVSTWRWYLCLRWVFSLMFRCFYLMFQVITTSRCVSCCRTSRKRRRRRTLCGNPTPRPSTSLSTSNYPPIPWTLPLSPSQPCRASQPLKVGKELNCKWNEPVVCKQLWSVIPSKTLFEK